MARQSLEQIVNFLEAWGMAHVSVKRVGADFEEQVGNFFTKSERFPAMFITLDDGVTFGGSTNTYTMQVICMDVIQKDRPNIKHILSDTERILNDLSLELTDGDNWDLEAEVIADVERYNNSQLDYLAGNKVTLTITAEAYSVCEIPVGDFIDPQEPCPDSTVSNSDDSYLVVVGSGDDLELPDTQYNIYVNGNLDQSFSVPTLKNETININA